MPTTKISIDFPVKIFKERNSWIVYNKKHEISGYGKTKQRAIKMFKFCVSEFLKLSLTKSKTQ